LVSDTPGGYTLRFERDLTRLNKEFHSKYQPTGFTTYKIKFGIACQTSTYKDYLNIQKFLKENKVPFNPLKSASAKPFKVVIKGIPPPLLPKLFKPNYNPSGWSSKTSSL
jgi:hypothetical protein